MVPRIIVLDIADRRNLGQRGHNFLELLHLCALNRSLRLNIVSSFINKRKQPNGINEEEMTMVHHDRNCIAAIEGLIEATLNQTPNPEQRKWQDFVDEAVMKIVIDTHTNETNLAKHLYYVIDLRLKPEYVPPWMRGPLEYQEGDMVSEWLDIVGLPGEWDGIRINRSQTEVKMI
jgi:hypothetical protein